MLRILGFLITAALLALGIAWFADRPGAVSITWLGYQIETSILVTLFAVALLAAFIIAVWSIYRAILRSPDQVSIFFRHRRAARGYLAITRGLIAIGAGDHREARRSADEAARLSSGDPLVLLLTAQSAQMEGDRVAAERAFRDMVRREDTKLLGLRGLYVEAQRRNDAAAARLFAEEAAGLRCIGAGCFDHPRQQLAKFLAQFGFGRDAGRCEWLERSDTFGVGAELLHGGQFGRIGRTAGSRFAKRGSGERAPRHGVGAAVLCNFGLSCLGGLLDGIELRLQGFGRPGGSIGAVPRRRSCRR
jgi:hypothetical protein